MTGGIFSIGIIVTIVVAFANMIGDTINKNTIEYSQSTIKDIDPPKIKIEMSPENHNMLGFKLVGYNLNQDRRLFDVVASGLICKNGCADYEYRPIEL